MPGSGEFGSYSELHEHFGLGALGQMGFGSGMGMGTGVGAGLSMSGVGVGVGQGLSGIGVGGGQIVGQGHGQGQGQGERKEKTGGGGRGMPYHFNHPSSSSTSDPTAGRVLAPHPHPPGPTSANGTMSFLGNPSESGGETQELDENGIPILGGANARIQDDKQRKRIMQACEPCRVRKARVSRVSGSASGY